MGSCLGVSMQICNFLKDLKHVAMSLHNLKYVLKKKKKTFLILKESYKNSRNIN